MASITLKDYLISLSTKGSISDSDLLPLLDSGADNALKKITKGALVNLSDIDGFTEFSSSIEGDLFALSFASGASVETSLQQQIDINNLGAYTQSLKSAIQIDGTDVQIVGELRADKFYVNYITSSVSLLTGSNEFGDTLADRHTFIGDVYINGDGPIGLLQLNTQTGSQNTLNASLGLITSSLYGEVSSFNSVFSGVSAVTGAFATELGELQTQNTSQGGVNSGTSAVTGAFATELGGIQTTLSGHRNELSGIEAWTASLDDTFATDAQVADAVAALNTQTGSQNSINSGISAVSGAFATELGQLQNNVTDFTNVLSGVAAVSGAIVAELGGIQNNITSFNGVFGGVSAVTGAFATELGQLQTQNTSQGGVNSGTSAVTGAFATELGQLQTQNTSQGGVNSGVSAVTGAFATELGQLQTQNTSQNGVNSGISAVTGAFATELGGIQNNITSFNNVFGGVSAVTGAFATELGGIQTTLSGHRNELSGLELYTSSLKGAIEISGQDVNVLGMITAQQFNVTYVSSSVMYQSGSTRFGDTSDDRHGFTGSLFVSGTVAIGDAQTGWGRISFNEPTNTLRIQSSKNGTDCIPISFWSQASGGGFAERLVISGSNVEVKSAGKLQVFRSDNTRSGSFYTDNLATVVEAGTDPLRLSSPERAEIYVAGAERARFTSAGIQIGTSTTDTSLGSNTRLKVVGDGSVNAGASQGSLFIAAGTEGGDTGLPINMGTAGATMMLLASINTSTGTSTNSATYIVRFYFDGDNAPTTTYLGGSSDFVTFGVTPSNTLAVSGSSAGNKSYAWFINKFGV